MPAKKPLARTSLSPMPLSELPMMKALMALTVGRTAPRNPAAKGDPKTQLTTMRLTIIDKLQVLALRRPQTLVIIAQVLDMLLDEQLNILDDQLDSGPAAKTRWGEARRTGHHRIDAR